MTPVRRTLINQLRADIRQATGREYAINYDALDEQTVRELLRLLIDMKYERQRALNNEKMRARRMPWLVK